MKGLKQLIVTALCLLAFSSQVVNGKVIPLDAIVAVVDKDVVMKSELDNRMAAVKRQLQGRNIPMPPDAVLAEQVLEQLILENIQLQIGQRAGINIDDLTLNDAISKIAQRNGMDLQQFKTKLESDGISFAQARNDIRREMIINRVRQRLVAERVHISEQEIDNFLKSPEGQSQLETEYRLGHILIPTPENASPAQIKAAQKQADEVMAQLKKGANFPELALTYSKGQNALQGGDLGWRKADQLPTLFVEQAMTLEQGQVSGPVRSPNGFHIFKLLGLKGDVKHVQEQVNVRHILIKPNEIRSNLEAKMLAEQLYKRIENGESFSELAKAYSDDTASTLNGGNLGWVNPASLVPEFQVVMKNEPLNTVSQPFKTAYGWHILEVLGKRKSDISDEVLRNQVRTLLGNRKFEEELSVWLREIRSQAYVENRLKEK
ncbi:peptidylprolyl isomerase [Candidatus Sororendozoicomonas aggregata]|uniref:peptidylprolyl isomerase n=1 Tax=Candidatus Sororendozoicomonas aggregata TaxID=3073239 RepID=UPI002ED39173